MDTTPQTAESTPSSKEKDFGIDMSPEIQKTMEKKKPLRFAKLIVRCPCLLCISILILLVIISYVDSQFFLYTSDANRMYLVESNEYTIKMDGLVLAQEHIASAASKNESVTPQTQIEGFWTYQLMFKLDNPSIDNYWILTPENIKIIIEYENKIYLSNAWQNQFCAITENETLNHYNFSCINSIQSIARDIAILYDYNYTLMRINDIKEYVLSRINNPYYSILFNPDINSTKECTIYRSIFHAALPISTNINGNIHSSKYRNGEDRKDEQELIYSEWAQELWTDITVNNNGEYVDGNLEILALSYVVFVEYFIGLLSEAMFYVLFAIMAVYIYMTIHLRSFILSFAALIQILMSFPLAFFFYRLLFQVTHFDTFSSLIIFVLLGVGADDVFVFTDAWYQSVNFINNNSKEKNELLLDRMSFAYSRASKAMFITQITTFFAFMATATSLIMPISAFGIWAGTIVACNYILVITMYPCILILHEKYLKKYEQMICCCICNFAFKSSKKKTNEDNNNNYRSIEKFFGGKFTDFILKFRVFILIFFLIIYGLCSFSATQIEANRGDEVWFEDDHFMQVVSDSANEFTAGETDGLFDVWVVWGVSGVNRDGTNKWDSNDYGIVKWDNTFDMSSINGQIFIQNICNDLKENELSFDEDVVICFIDYFELYLNSINMSYPILLSDNKQQQKLLFAELMYSFLHESEYGEYIRNYGLVYVDHNEINNEYEIKFIAIKVLSDVAWDSHNDEIINEFNKWNEWMDDIKTNCVVNGEAYCSAYHSSWAWADFAIKDAFVSSAIQGVIIAMPLAFIILLISTQNYIISIFAVLDIIGIMLCELGLMATMGWQFGISEAISTVMIIGFSVDYVVHLANAYLECSNQYDLRSDRLRFALLTMGISVVSGAITTFSAGFFLIFPVILFFFKMGVLMMSTIAFSIIFAMFFFTSLLAQFGPQYNNGNICCCLSKKNKSENENGVDGDIEMQ